MEESIAILIEQIPLGIITFSRNGDVDYINQNFHKFGLLYQFHTSLQKINLFEYDIFQSINIRNELKEIIKGRSFEREIKHIDTNNGEFVSLILKGTPVYEEENVSGGMLVIEDLKILTETSEELRLKSKLTDDFINKGDDFLIVVDTAGEIKYSAGKDNARLKLYRKDVTGKNIGEIFSSSAKQKILEAYSTAVKYRKFQLVQIDITSEDDTKKINCTIEPVIGERGNIQFLYLIFREAPEEREDIKSLLEKLNGLEYYLEIARKKQFALILVKNSGEIIFVDKQLEKIFGIEKEELSNKSVTDLFPLLVPDEFSKIVQKLDVDNSYELFTNIQNDNVDKIPVNLTFLKCEEDSCTIIIVCTQLSRDSSALKKEEEAKPTEFKLQFEEIAEPICKIDSRGSILFANQAFKSKLMFPEIELYGKNFFELIRTETTVKIKEEVAALKMGELKSFYAKIKNSGGTEDEANLTFKVENLVNDKPHTIYCYLGKYFEMEKKSPVSIYKSLFVAAQDGMAVELDEKILITNNSFAKIFGYKNAEELENKNILELVSEDDIPKVKDHFTLKKTGKKTLGRIEFLAKKKDSSTFYAEFSVASFEENEQSFLVIVAMDVTERKRAQKVIQESEQKYRNITESIDDFLFTFERAGKYLRPLFYTTAVQKVTGYTQAEFLGDPKLFLKIIHPDDIPGVKEKVRYLWSSNLQVTSELEFRIITKEANVVWVRNKLNLVRDSEGKIQRVYGLVSDISLSKRAEEELKQSATNLKKLNDAKDRFLSIISHDLRTPFSSILGFTDLLLDDDTISDTERKQYITYIQDSSKSMLALVNSLLEWTRLQTGRIKFEPEKVNAKELIDRSISTVSGSALKKGIEIANLVDSSYNLFADKSLILQVFNNLLSNAVKFTRRGDGITINVKAFPNSRFIKFSVKDTGKGIKPENLSKLFNIDTKFTSEGTAGERGSGLGLSLVKEIIEKHGGAIEVNSEYEKGTEFIFTLPVASTKILLVDHNKRDRILYSKILMNITPEYAVSVVSNGNEALDRINTSPPALVITEHQMPVMNGYTLIRELIKRGLKAAIPVIVLTSEIERSAIQDYAELGIEHIFTKPVNLRSFKESIEKSIRKGIINNSHST